MNKNLRDCRDTFVMIAVSAGWAAGTVYLFLHPSDAAFVTWAGLVTTIVGAYHFLVMYDDKHADEGARDAGTA